ncbi:MAG: family 20 glycosylhydrolase [Porphyromonadaceae bacterium]|nr:family 20 glycosylhydrolase [Porphyromonadaceae bacterium]
MKKLFTSMACALALCVGGTTAWAASAPSRVSTPLPSYDKGINIIPRPKQLQELKLPAFRLTATTPVIASGDSAVMIARFFTEKINRSTGFSLRVVPGTKATQQAIFVRIDPKLALGDEGYTLNSSPRGVEIVGRSAKALFWGFQSLMQLLPAEVESAGKVGTLPATAWTIPAVRISDEPAFEYRGVMVDVCRHFLTVDEMKKHIDIISLFKINKLHWHLTEDQGWRIEIKKYPRLTEVGAWRIEGDGSRYGGFYTQDQVREIVRYAQDRFVTIIPEIEMPGHGMGAIASYPELTCFPNRRKYIVRNIWGIEDDVYCAGKESTFEFIQNVLDEVVPLFPGEYFHIGGDECPKDRWKECPNCQKRIKAEGLKDEHELQSYVIRRAEKMLAKHGKKLIGWDEILEGGLAPTATVMSWRGEDGGIQSANMGHDVIMTPGSGGLYIDHYQGDPKIEPVAICCYAPLEKVYNYNPIPEAIAPDKRHHIKGAQTNLWAEYLYTPEIMQYRAFPREIALAEAVWSPISDRDFKDFSRRLDNAYVRLDMHGANYHIPQPEQPLPNVDPKESYEKTVSSLNFIAFTDSAELSLKTTRPIRIVYTRDGSTPTLSSESYTMPLKVTKSEVIRVASILPSGKTSPVREITFEKQTLAPAATVANLKPGLATKTSIGDYYQATDLIGVTNWTKGVAKRPQDLRPDVVKNHMAEIKPKAVIGDGYVKIPKDGVYVFSTDLDQMYIDGKLLIDNSGEVAKSSRRDKSVALKAGWHKIRLIFIGAVRGGFPTYWDGAAVAYRNIKDNKFTNITEDMLAH